MVLDAVNAQTAGLGEDLLGAADAPVDRTELIMAGLGSEAGLLAPVELAVAATLSEQAAALTSISNRINAGLLGVLNAFLAYDRGQLDMAAEFQNAAADAATSGNFSYFDANGVQ